MRNSALLTMVASLCMAASAATAQQPSPVRLNQLGMLPVGAKLAVVPHSSRDRLRWQLVDSNGRVQASGTTRVFGRDGWSGQHVHQVDFTRFATPGTAYTIRVGGVASRPFGISAATYDRLPYDALAYFYHNRAGTPIEARYVGARWARPAGHPREVATCISGKDSNGNVWPGCPYTREVTGGWYDAGDHGKYVVNGGIALWTLLNLYERNQLFGKRALFADGTARIPESGNGVPDILDEARWEIAFFLKMQVPDGTRLKVPVGAKRNVKGLTFVEVDASGMAHHKVGDERWTALPLRPDQDRERRMLFPPSTGATLNLAAVTAQCARIWRAIDAALAASCLAASERAWKAALRNPNIHAIDEFTGSGGYGDSDFSDEFYWAAAELLATTGKDEYRQAVERSRLFRDPIGEAAGWPATAPLGTITLALVPDAVGASERDRLRGLIAAAADRFLGDVESTGYAIPYAPAEGYPWGSNSNLLNRAILLALASDFTADSRYRDGVIHAMDYLLGRNPLDRSFIAGYGARPMRNPHHRFWANSLDPQYPPPPPGALSGGPNSMNSPRADEPVGPPKGCAPQTCWVDAAGSFTTNEVAINWNAPLVWVSAWLAQRPAAAPVSPERGR